MSDRSRMKFIRIKDPYLLSVIIMIKAVGLFSSPKLKEFVAGGIASAAYHLSREKRRLIEKNLSRAFDGGLSEEQKQKITKGAFYEFWKDTFSLSLSGKERSALKGVELRGLGHLQSALKQGKGVILWESSGFGRRSLAKQILYENGFSVRQVHAERHLGGFGDGGASWVRLHIIKPFFEKLEKQFITEIIYLPNSDSLAFTRRLLGRLNQNAIICITGDTTYGQKLILRQFLGHTKLFATGMVSLAKISGAPILPMFCIRERNGKTALIIEPPIKIKTSVDRENSLEHGVAEYAGLLESYIKKYPEKYRSWDYVDHLSEHRGYY